MQFLRSVGNPEPYSLLNISNNLPRTLLDVEQKKAICCSIYIHNIEKLFLITWHRTTEVLWGTDKVIDSILSDKIDALQCACRITDTNHDRSSICICKGRNEWCKIGWLDLRRFTIKIFILLLMQNIVQCQHPIDRRAYRHNRPPFCKKL